MKKSALIAGAAMSILLLSACGTTAPASENPGAEEEMTDITVGVIPIVDTAPLYLGVEKGFFEEEGLNVTVQIATGGAAAVPGVVAGSYDFAFGNIVSLMVAQDQGLDLKSVTNGVSAGDPKNGYTAVIVKGDSPIKTPKDLAGKTISVNNLSNIGDTTIRAVVDADGGDASTIKFVEVSFPDVEAAIANGQIDASWTVEPFLSASIAHGQRSVTSPLGAFDPDLDVSSYFAMADTIKNKPELVEAFRAAINKSLEYAQEHPDEVRQIVTTYTEIPEEALAEIILPTWRVEMNRDAAKKLGEAALKYGTLEKAPNLDNVVVE